MQVRVATLDPSAICDTVMLKQVLLPVFWSLMLFQSTIFLIAP
jgi:hypothetical protein